MVNVAGGESIPITVASSVDTAKKVAEASGKIIYIFNQAGEKIAA